MGVPFGTAVQGDRLFIGPNGLSGDPERIPYSLGTVTMLGGSAPTELANDIIGGAGDEGAYIFNDAEDNNIVNIQIAKAVGANWQSGDILNWSISFSDEGLYDLTSWDASGAIVSAGRSESGYADNPNPEYQVGSFASVPDTGSTAALLGLGVVALAFARRRLG